MRAEGITIRPYEAKDFQAAKQMAQAAFPFFQRFSLVFEEGVYLLEKEGSILGMIKGKIFESRQKKIGVISWLVIEKNSQSKAYAGPLMFELMAYFENSECDDVLACAHHTNTASSSGMSYFEFKPISLTEQWGSYGAEIFKVWKKSYHVFDYAHLLWRKDIKPREVSVKKDSFALHLLLNGILVACMVLVGWSSGLLGGVVVGCAYLCLRRICFEFKLKQSIDRDLRYQGWESGYLLSGIMSLCTGFWVPNPGLDVPDSDRWRVKKLEKPMMLGALLWVILGLIASRLVHIQSSIYGLFVAKALWAEVTLCFFPFQALAGGWIFKSNKGLWALVWLITSLNVLWMFYELMPE